MHKNCFWHVSTQLRLAKNCDTMESRYNEGHGDLQNTFLVRHIEASPLTKPFHQLQMRDKL